MQSEICTNRFNVTDWVVLDDFEENKLVNYSTYICHGFLVTNWPLKVYWKQYCHEGCWFCQLPLR